MLLFTHDVGQVSLSLNSSGLSSGQHDFFSHNKNDHSNGNKILLGT